MKAPAFQLYAADFYMDTLTWTTEEIGAYLRLLLFEWINGPLPGDIKALNSICGCPQEKHWKRHFTQIWTRIGPKFAQISTTKYPHLAHYDQTMLVNIRLEMEREKQINYRDNQSIKGKKSAEKRAATVQPRLKNGCNRKATLQSSSSSSIKDKTLYGECVYLTAEEHQRLLDKFGDSLTTKAIDILNNYIMSSGKKYKSHYHTLLLWPMKRAEEGNGNGSNVRSDARPWLRKPGEELSGEAQRALDDVKRAEREYKAKHPATNNPGKDA